MPSGTDSAIFDLDGVLYVKRERVTRDGQRKEMQKWSLTGY